MRVAKAEEKGRERNGEVARVTECPDFLLLDCGVEKLYPPAQVVEFGPCLRISATSIFTRGILPPAAVLAL